MLWYVTVCEDRGVWTHLSLIIVCNSRIWSFKGSSLSWGPRLSWLTGSMVASFGSELDSTAGALLLLLLANRTCFIGCSWPLLTLLNCCLWHGISSMRLRLRVFPQNVYLKPFLDRATHLTDGLYAAWQRGQRVLPLAWTVVLRWNYPIHAATAYRLPIRTTFTNF